ncbi:hypothetical protein K438DRAFT_1937695 [Mycena galopus ATCC 62051]|nr:hypothetical protein K438DRAFT_1937695 [Mycena galopus ATCC 62051]
MLAGREAPCSRLPSSFSTSASAASAHVQLICVPLPPLAAAALNKPLVSAANGSARDHDALTVTAAVTVWRPALAMRELRSPRCACTVKRRPRSVSAAMHEDAQAELRMSVLYEFERKTVLVLFIHVLEPWPELDNEAMLGLFCNSSRRRIAGLGGRRNAIVLEPYLLVQKEARKIWQQHTCIPQNESLVLNKMCRFAPASQNPQIRRFREANFATQKTIQVIQIDTLEANSGFEDFNYGQDAAGHV